MLVKILKDMLHCAADDVLFRSFHIKQAPNLDLHIFQAVVLSISDEKGLLNGGIVVDIEQHIKCDSLRRASFPEFRLPGIPDSRSSGILENWFPGFLEFRLPGFPESCVSFAGMTGGACFLGRGAKSCWSNLPLPRLVWSVSLMPAKGLVALLMRLPPSD